MSYIYDHVKLNQSQSHFTKLTKLKSNPKTAKSQPNLTKLLETHGNRIYLFVILLLIVAGCTNYQQRLLVRAGIFSHLVATK